MNNFTLSASYSSPHPSNKSRKPASFIRHRQCKEMDAETGLYYYGARYLDPKTSRWLGVDPAMGEYVPSPGGDPSKLRGEGGIYNSINMHAYHYSFNNPVKYMDPNGKWGKNVHLTKTNQWATEKNVRSEYASIIAIANYSVDRGSTNPITGDQSWHFNTNNASSTFPEVSSSGHDGDSRKQNFEGQFHIAVALINDGQIEQGLKAFGVGLHALQDMEAHSDEFVGVIDFVGIGKKWSHAFSGLGNPKVPKIGAKADNIRYDERRFSATETVTKNAIDRLKDAIHEDKRNIIFSD